MTQKKQLITTPDTYYVSPKGKVHAETCRHCQPDKDGWKKLESLEVPWEKSYQLCRLCCPENMVVKSTEGENKPIEVESTKKYSLETDKTETKSDKDSGKERKTDTKQEKSTKKDKKKEEKPTEPAKRYKILAGNGCHQAIAEVRGILIPPAEDETNFSLILPDGFKMEVTFQNSKLLWLAHNQPNLLGAHWFRGYPKMKDYKLVSLQVIAWDGNMPTNPRGDEHWEFTGVWTLQKTLTVQRSMMLKDIRKTAKETGFIKKFKYTFINSFEWMKNKKLWSGYVYKVFCKRQGDVLEIKKVIPFACPRIKPVPKQSGDNKKPFNSGEKPPFDKNKPFNKTKISYKPK